MHAQTQVESYKAVEVSKCYVECGGPGSVSLLCQVPTTQEMNCRLHGELQVAQHPSAEQLTTSDASQAS